MTLPRDDYGVLGNEIEVDSDVNEDRNREVQLDDSFEAWYGNIDDQVKQKLDLNNVLQATEADSVLDLDRENLQ